MTETVNCGRCHKEGEKITSPPYPGDLGLEIQSQRCASCWAEWLHAEVMVINELKLNFMDPASQDILIGHMREFLLLDSRPPIQEPNQDI
jgi:Fe-S cluster biosynthesis and repair protein YggX